MPLEAEVIPKHATMLPKLRRLLVLLATASFYVAATLFGTYTVAHVVEDGGMRLAFGGQVAMVPIGVFVGWLWGEPNKSLKLVGCMMALLGLALAVAAN